MPAIAAYVGPTHRRALFIAHVPSDEIAGLLSFAQRAMSRNARRRVGRSASGPLPQHSCLGSPGTDREIRGVRSELRDDLLVESPHAAEPAVGVGGAVAVEFFDFRMGEDQEALVAEALDDLFGDVFRGDGRHS